MIKPEDIPSFSPQCTSIKAYCTTCGCGDKSPLMTRNS